MLYANTKTILDINISRMKSNDALTLRHDSYQFHRLPLYLILCISNDKVQWRICKVTLNIGKWQFRNYQYK